jgi:hypothetical protein
VLVRRQEISDFRNIDPAHPREMLACVAGVHVMSGMAAFLVRSCSF